MCLNSQLDAFINVLFFFQGCNIFILILSVFHMCVGSGKSYLAKMLRDLEVENGGNAPRIHSMDDYFMNEVEKVGFWVLLRVYVKSLLVANLVTLFHEIHLLFVHHCMNAQLFHIDDLTIC